MTRMTLPKEVQTVIRLAKQYNGKVSVNQATKQMSISFDDPADQEDFFKNSLVHEIMGYPIKLQ